jgi:glycosyltransferase involved in cell wall biosynthesis
VIESSKLRPPTALNHTSLQLKPVRPGRFEAGPLHQAIRNLVPPRLRGPLRRAYSWIWCLSQRPKLPALTAELETILSRFPEKNNTFVFVPSVEWAVWLFQRPQQLATALAKEGALVFYMEPAHSTISIGFSQLTDNLYLSRVPTEVFQLLKQPKVFVQAWNREHLAGFHEPFIIYDYIDELEVFPFDQVRLRKAHEDVLRTALMVLTSSDQLYAQVARSNSQSLLCPNGVDYEHFAPARDQTNVVVPDDLKPVVDTGKPTVVYYGALARWLDYDLIEQAARRRPDLAFVLIGPDWDQTLAKTTLLERSNVTWLGPKPYSQLPFYLRQCDVAMIPFQLTKLTHAVSPLKLFEYMASGKPVVATATRECTRYEGVLTAIDSKDFVDKLDLALQLRNNREYLDLIDRVAQENSWQARAQQILSALTDL